MLEDDKLKKALDVLKTSGSKAVKILDTVGRGENKCYRIYSIIHETSENDPDSTEEHDFETIETVNNFNDITKDIHSSVKK